MSKLTEVWCTPAERANAGFQDIVKAEIDPTSKERYKMVVYISGNGNLPALTAALLKQNKD